jgi:prophage endopeptidase
MTKYLIAALALALVLALWRIDSVTAARDGALDASASSEARAASLRNTLKLSRMLLTERDDIDARNTTELAHVRKTNDGLRADVADGRKRLLIKSTCRVPAANSSSAASVDDAGSAELSADARQDYYTLRDQLALSRQMIKGLQEYATLVRMKSAEQMPGAPE